MTYNVANGLASPDALIALVRRSGADIVGLQELASSQASALERRLKDLYPYQVLHPLGIPGKGLLSRLPIEDAHLLYLNPGRPDLQATVAVGGNLLTVIVAHPPPPRIRGVTLVVEEATHRQIDGLIEAATSGRPTVMLGDFNVVDWHANYRRIVRAGLIDAFESVGRGTGETLPKRMARWATSGHPFGKIPLPPLVRVDYVWLSRHLRPLDAWVGPDGGSDHLPVLARMVFTAESGSTVWTHPRPRTGRHWRRKGTRPFGSWSTVGD